MGGILYVFHLYTNLKIVSLSIYMGEEWKPLSQVKYSLKTLFFRFRLEWGKRTSQAWARSSFSKLPWHQLRITVPSGLWRCESLHHPKISLKTCKWQVTISLLGITLSVSLYWYHASARGFSEMCTPQTYRYCSHQLSRGLWCMIKFEKHWLGEFTSREGHKLMLIFW